MKRRRNAKSSSATVAFSRGELQGLGGVVVIAVAASILMSMAAQTRGPEQGDPSALASATAATPAAQGLSAN